MLRCLMLCCCALSLAALDFTLHVVDEATWRDDIKPGWMRAYATNRNSLTWDLVLPPGGQVVPMPRADGMIDATAWRAFRDTPLNPTKNAVRLLGPPDQVQVLEDGRVRMVWTRARLTGAKAIGLATDLAGVTLTATEVMPNGGCQIEWGATPIAGGI